jgi:putative IMPACT (imprinted ancient) family translation regulator
MPLLEYWLKKLDGKIIKQEFTEQVRLVIQLPAEQVQALLQPFQEAMDYLTASKMSL